MPGELIIGGLALLLLLGGKKKKKKSDKLLGDEDGSNEGSSLDGPTEEKIPGGGGSGGGSKGGTGKGGGAPSNLANDAVWVSPDCKVVVFGDDTGEAFWKNKGLPVAQEFISANYNDPYEIAKLMIISMAPCVVEFPVTEDGFTPMEEEFKREMFNRDFKEVYYLVQFLHDKISELMEREEYIVEFDDRCDVTFVGDLWFSPIAKRMARFYMDYMYPAASEADHEEKYPAWPLADIPENHMSWSDNIATAIINRMHPECGLEIVEAFKKEPFTAKTFFSTRPGLDAVYKGLHEIVNITLEQQVGGLGLDFEKLDKLHD